MSTYDVDKIAARILEMVGTLHKEIFKRSDDTKGMEKSGQTAVLFTLDKRGASQMSELGKALEVTKPNITFLVDKLESDGLVRRVQDPMDRRVTKIEITDSGQKYIKEIKKQLLERVKNKLISLDESDMDTLNDGLNKLLTVLSKIKSKESEYRNRN